MQHKRWKFTGTVDNCFGTVSPIENICIENEHIWTVWAVVVWMWLNLAFLCDLIRCYTSCLLSKHGSLLLFELKRFSLNTASQRFSLPNSGSTGQDGVCVFAHNTWKSWMLIYFYLQQIFTCVTKQKNQNNTGMIIFLQASWARSERCMRHRLVARTVASQNLLFTSVQQTATHLGFRTSGWEFRREFWIFANTPTSTFAALVAPPGL